MLQVDLLRLRPGRSLPVKAKIEPGADVWTGSELALAEPVEVDATASLTAEGDVLVRGRWRAAVLQECGRCLEPATVEVDGDLALLYRAGCGMEEAHDPDVRVIGRSDTAVDLGEAIREEVLLEAPRYLLPPAVQGRCTHCGKQTEQFRHSGERPSTGPDPRWAALAALRTDDTQPD